MLSDPATNENTYVMDPESSEEMARLIDQDYILNEAQGTLFPQGIDPGGVRRVLDVACGPGGWALEVASAYPGIDVVGIDISRVMVEYATRHATARQHHNVHFQVMDVRQSLAFPDATLDIVNARFTFSFLPRDEWPSVLKEFVRLTRPGGTIVSTECDTFGEDANSQAFQEFIGYMCEAVYRSGLYGGPENGVTSRLASLLHNAGCQNIQHQWHTLDFSAGAPAHHAIVNNITLGMKLAQPFLLKMGVASQERLNDIYEQALLDTMQENFQAHWNFLRVWGSRL